jgi:hypothetical protein
VHPAGLVLVVVLPVKNVAVVYDASAVVKEVILLLLLCSGRRSTDGGHWSGGGELVLLPINFQSFLVYCPCRPQISLFGET